jgi:N-acyl-L-homoserine lactone synthetase
MDCVAVETKNELKSRLISPNDTGALGACFGLRYQYFVERRGWVNRDQCRGKIESDTYDHHALHIGVWEVEEVTAYLRVLPFDSEVGFMIDRELSALLSAEERAALPRDDAVELSRLVCRDRNSFQEPQNGRHPIEHLFKQFYHLSLQRSFTIFYIVVETSWLRLFRRRFGLAFRVLGQPHTFPDGTQTVAAVATLEELEAGIRAHNPAKFQWYCEPL